MKVVLDSLDTSALETEELNVVEEILPGASTQTYVPFERQVVVTIPPEMKATTPHNPFQRQVIGQWLLEALDIVRGIIVGTAQVSRLNNSTQTDFAPKLSLSDLKLRWDENFSVVISRIINLLHDEDETKPTDYALNTTLEILFEAQRFIDRRYEFPRAAVSSDEEGAINVHWRNPTRKVQLSIPANMQGQMFVYHREGDKHAFEYNVSGRNLADWLNWFSAA